MKTFYLYALTCLSPFLSFAADFGDWHGCTNCEALVTLDASKAQELSDAVMVISSMPLTGKVIDPGVKGGQARVLIGTYPQYATAHGYTSFDVAKIMTAWANDLRFGITSVTAVWHKRN